MSTRLGSTFTQYFRLNSTSSCKFHHSQWETCRKEEHVSVPYLVYRISYMMLLISSITFSTLCQSYLFQIYLTNWSFTIQVLYATLAAVNIVWRKSQFQLQSLCMKLRRLYPNNRSGKHIELCETNTTTMSPETVVYEDTSTPEGVEKKNAGVSQNSCGRMSNGYQEQNNDLSLIPSTTTLASPNEETRITISNNNNDSIKNGESNDDPPNGVEKLIWILMNLSHVLPHIVVAGYWLFVYKYNPDQKPCERFRSHFIVHGITSVLALLDALVVAVPVEKVHFVFPTFVLFVYTVFSYLYELGGGPYRNGNDYIYSILNWKHKPGRTVLFITAGLIASPLAHTCMCWGIHRLKLKFHSYLAKRRTSS